MVSLVVSALCPSLGANRLMRLLRRSQASEIYPLGAARFFTLNVLAPLQQDTPDGSCAARQGGRGSKRPVKGGHECEAQANCTIAGEKPSAAVLGFLRRAELIGLVIQCCGFQLAPICKLLVCFSVCIVLVKRTCLSAILAIPCAVLPQPNWDRAARLRTEAARHGADLPRLAHIRRCALAWLLAVRASFVLRQGPLQYLRGC
jgi:drug/metabolite transporter superfamily protein YnfA